MFYKRIFWCFLVFLFFACNRNKNPYENKLGIEPSVIAEMDTAHYTIIQWKDTLYNFGTLKAGDSTHLQFQFTNVGETPLFVFDTRTTCGCTITDFPKDPVMPGKSGFIAVTFKSGILTGEINKRIVVVANAKNNKYSGLIIRGVIESPGKTNQ